MSLVVHHHKGRCYDLDLAAWCIEKMSGSFQISKKHFTNESDVFHLEQITEDSLFFRCIVEEEEEEERFEEQEDAAAYSDLIEGEASNTYAISIDEMRMTSTNLDTVIVPLTALAHVTDELLLCNVLR